MRLLYSISITSQEKKKKKKVIMRSACPRYIPAAAEAAA